MKARQNAPSTKVLVSARWEVVALVGGFSVWKAIQSRECLEPPLYSKVTT